jgi:hypothetical protein
MSTFSLPISPISHPESSSLGAYERDWWQWPEIELHTSHRWWGRHRLLPGPYLACNCIAPSKRARLLLWQLFQKYSEDPQNLLAQTARPCMLQRCMRFLQINNNLVEYISPEKFRLDGRQKKHLPVNGLNITIPSSIWKPSITHPFIVTRIRRTLQKKKRFLPSNPTNLQLSIKNNATLLKTNTSILLTPCHWCHCIVKWPSSTIPLFPQYLRIKPFEGRMYNVH